MKKTLSLTYRLILVIWLILLISVMLYGFFLNDVTKAELLDNCNGVHNSRLEDNELLDTYVNRDKIYSSSMKNYYFNLRKNFGYNERGSCGYVALGMILTYYDSYYNDKLVAEKYDAPAYMNSLSNYTTASSPGSVETAIDSFQNLTDYYNSLVNQYSNTSLHAKLASIGKDLGYGLGTTPDYLKNIFEKYIELNEQCDSKKWSIIKYSNDSYQNNVPNQSITYSEMMFNNIKSYLKSDHPVLVSMKNENNEGHVVVAYDYDEEQDAIFAHYGWDVITHRNIFSEGFKYIRGYIVIDTSDVHTHSNNYIIDGSAMCSCSLPNHKHIFTYKSKNAINHSKTCYCGYTELESHRFTKYGTGSAMRYIFCEHCGYAKLDDGKVPPIIQLNQGEVTL